MKRLSIFVLCLLVIGVVSAATLKSDITDQGVESYVRSQVTAQQLGDMIRDHEDVTAANTLTQSECGKTMFLNSATEFATTLPAPAAGCYFKFIVKAAPSGAHYTIVTNGSDNILIGGINELEVDTNDDGEYDADADTITFHDSPASAVGDYVEMISDGTSWYFTGQSNLDGAVAVTKAS